MFVGRAADKASKLPPGGAGRGGGRVDPGVEVLKREMKAEYVPIVAKIRGGGRPQAAHHDKKHPTTK